MNNLEAIYIYGCGGHARSVGDVLLKQSPKANIIFVDVNAMADERIFGFPVVKETKRKINFYAVGDNMQRKRFYENDHEKLISIISPYAAIGRESQIGKGVFLGNFSHIGGGCSIADNCIINTSAVVEHECEISPHVHIAPNACVCGRCKIGEGVFIGSGASVIDKIKICSNTIVGAGATVVRDILEPGVYVGNPVKKIKSLPI